MREVATHGGLETFDDRAGSFAPPVPAVEARAVRPAVPGRFRRRALVVAAVCLALLLVPAVPLAPGGLAPESTPLPGRSAPVSSDADVLGRPTRGSLAGDTDFVDAVRRLPWAPPESDRPADFPVPSVTSRHVVFAGDVPGGRWALVVAAQSSLPPRPSDALPIGALWGTWFTGLRGARPEQLTPQPVRHGLAADRPTALIGPRTGALVVVAAAGDVVTVSERPDVAADGRVSRNYRRVQTSDGVAVVPLQASEFPYSTATAFQVLRNGGLVTGAWPEALDDPAEPPPVAIAYPRGLPPGSGRQVARDAATTILTRLGLRRADVEVTALWVGPVPRPGSLSGEAAIVAVTVPSGAVVLDAEWLVLEQSADYFLGGHCGQGVVPAGPPASRRVVAMSCDVLVGTEAAPMRASLVVVGPPEVVRVRAYTGDGTVLGEVPADAGVVVAPLPLGTDTVQAFTASGQGLGPVALLDRTADIGN